MVEKKYKTIKKSCVVCNKTFTCKLVCLKTKLYCSSKCAYSVRSEKEKAYKRINKARISEWSKIKYLAAKQKVFPKKVLAL